MINEESKGGKEGSFKILFIVMGLSLIVALLWDKISWIKNSIHAIFNPSLGGLLNWNVTLGMFTITILIALITTLAQKYGTDQATIRELKARQKEINKKSKEFRHDPQKMMEIQKELMPVTMQLMKLSMRPMVFTSIPIILTFRWFNDYFALAGEIKFLGFLSWFWFYLIFVIIFSSILRKILKVV